MNSLCENVCGSKGPNLCCFKCVNDNILIIIDLPISMWILMKQAVCYINIYKQGASNIYQLYRWRQWDIASSSNAGRADFSGNE